VVQWQRAHGRHHLPWQATRNAYRIWLSEIMLQQTQVATVVPYYERFVDRFPDVRALADASLDDVLAHWSGLGYYSRARHLHRAAVIIRDERGGRFPDTLEALTALPGVGRSTAAAIMVFAYGARAAILDGNVKRVLARACGIEGYPGDKAVSDALWSAAERLLPVDDIEAYTQGLMDLGASVCVRSRPRCDVCPITAICLARTAGRVSELPAPRPRKLLPHRRTTMLVLEHAHEVLLEKRPAPGIWGGLWCFPEIDTADDAATFCARSFGVQVDATERLPDLEHGFTHFRLTISPVRVHVSAVPRRVCEAGHQWLSNDKAQAVAIPAPVKRILELLNTRADEVRLAPLAPR
jgi:A/G-specific adenine glycosylase